LYSWCIKADTACENNSGTTLCAGAILGAVTVYVHECVFVSVRMWVYVDVGGWVGVSERLDV